MAAENEYAQGESLFPEAAPTPLRLASGRLAVPMVKLIEIAERDTRMGRSQR